ncbi:MAG TPA: hypothetical protein PKZ92_03210 [Candidatus Woesebacteria bacterium]|jgi:hypothetical protein|nr:hypothetical protein [Candidatus Shapirobacteria bacterium]HOR02243.1 hypothetical protein [Candidatus Woesebacteria bacterium]
MDSKDLKQMSQVVGVGVAERLDKFETKLEKKLFNWKSEIFNLVDGLAKEIRDTREFRDISSHRISTNTRRIEILEKKVFGSVKSDT